MYVRLWHNTYRMGLRSRKLSSFDHRDILAKQSECPGLHRSCTEHSPSGDQPSYLGLLTVVPTLSATCSRHRLCTKCRVCNSSRGIHAFSKRKSEAYSTPLSGSCGHLRKFTCLLRERSTSQTVSNGTPRPPERLRERSYRTRHSAAED